MDRDELTARAIALHDRYAHAGQDRREFMAELASLAGGAAAAATLASAIAASPAAAAIVEESDARLRAATVRWPVADGRVLAGYRVAPAADAKALATVIVIHENRGLTGHIRDIARRVALAGFIAVAPDFLTAAGGTPMDEDKARAMIGDLDLAQVTADADATVDWAKAGAKTNGKVGAIGFCWGGALVNRVAVSAGRALSAAVAYYGPAPDPADAAKVKSAILLHYAGLDERVNASGRPWAAALAKAGARVESHVYEGVNHAFNNDTSAARYDAAAAALSWKRTIAFLERNLA